MAGLLLGKNKCPERVSDEEEGEVIQCERGGHSVWRGCGQKRRRNQLWKIWVEEPGNSINSSSKHIHSNVKHSFDQHVAYWEF